jgi:hypothetical protein
MRIRIDNTKERTPEMSQNAGSQRITHPTGAGPEYCSLHMVQKHQENREKISTVPVL